MSLELDKSLQLFFPIAPGGLNRQTFLNEVFTPQINRGNSSSNRGALATILYDDAFESGRVKGLPDDVYKRIISARSNKRNKIFSIHAEHHQDFEQGFVPGKPANAALERQYQEYLKFMSNIGSEELASLTPFVKLIYRYRKKENDPWKEFVIPFKSFSEESEYSPHTQVLSQKFARGDGAGIQTVSVKRNFPALGNILSVNVDISFFFQNINILTRKQKVQDVDDFSFIKVMAFLQPKFEELVLEYGYGISRFTDPSIIPPKIQSQILLKEKKRFILRYKSHNFNFEQDGTVKLTTSYTTQQDQDLFNKKSDISIPKGNFEIASLAKEEATKKLLQQYRELIANSQKIDDELRILKTKQQRRQQATRVAGNSQTNQSGQNFESRKRELEEKLRRQRRVLNKLNQQLAPLMKQNLIDRIRVNKELFKLSFFSNAEKKNDTRNFTFMTKLFLEESIKGKLQSTEIGKTAFSISSSEKFDQNIVFEEIKGKTGDQALEVLDRTMGTILNCPIGNDNRASDDSFGEIVFFSVRSLVTAAYENLEDDFKKNQAPFIGFSNIHTNAFGKRYSLNIGDILISSDEFQKWYYKNYLSQGKIIYSFGDFLNDIMTDLIPEILINNSISLFGRNNIGRIKPFFYLTKMTGDKKEQALFRSIYESNSKTDLKKFQNKLKTVNQGATGSNLKTVVLYTTLKGVSSPTTSPYLLRNLSSVNPPFDEVKDLKFNAPHVKIGADSGLLKNISFNAQDFPGLRTALWADSLVDSAEVLLKYRYSANVTTIGNNIFFKGGFFTIPANPLGIDKDTFDPGIVGYYAIQNVTDSISLGNYETSIAGTWVFNPAAQKGKSGTDVTQQNVEDLIPPTALKLSVVQYLEDLFRLDASVLAANGLNSDFSPSSRTNVGQPPQNDEYKDFKEPI